MTASGCIGLFIILLVLLVFTVAEYSYAAEPLTLEQAVAAALEHNPGLRAADAGVEAAEAGVLKSRSAFLPRVTLSETWTRTDSPLMALGVKLNRELVAPADFNPSVINDPAAISNYNTRLTVMQPVYSGGKEYLGGKQAALMKEASVQDRARARQETVYSTVKAYHGLLLAREYHRVAQKSLETSEANTRLAEARFRAGAVLQSDLLQARVQLAEVREMLTRSANNEKLATAALNFAMGVPQDAEYEVTGALSARTADAHMPDLLNEARSRRPDLLSVGLNRASAGKSVAMARAGYLPSLSVMGQTDWNSERIAGEDAKSWAVMAVLQWDLFDGLATRSNVKQALAAQSKIKSIEEQTRSAVELQVRQAYYSMTASYDRIAASASSVHEAEEGLRIVQMRYESGMTSYVDVLGAENALIRARTNALQALYDNNISETELKLAVGTL